MKKFTTLEEDLLKESESAQESFDTNFIYAQSKLDMIKTELDEFKSEYQGDLRNWGYAGSLGHVNELLDEILDFLTLNNANKEFISSRKIIRGELPGEY